METEQKFLDRCLDVRKLVMESVCAARRGHLPAAFSIVEILVVLYDHLLNFRSQEPDWQERDRFILSKGHGCLSLYAILADKEFFPKEELSRFCSFDGILGGHPTKEKIPGVEASTGSLGHGLSIGVGFCLGAQLNRKKYRTFVLLGDGECDEGSVWESALAASQHNLGNLFVLIDYNKHQSFASTRDVCNLEPFRKKWEAFGFDTHEVDMVQSPLVLKEILEECSQNSDKPHAVICHTIKGKGVPFMENDLSWHHKSKISDSDLERIMKVLED